jgi:hypothetical protein
VAVRQRHLVVATRKFFRLRARLLRIRATTSLMRALSRLHSTGGFVDAVLSAAGRETPGVADVEVGH